MNPRIEALEELMEEEIQKRDDLILELENKIESLEDELELSSDLNTESFSVFSYSYYVDNKKYTSISRTIDLLLDEDVEGVKIKIQEALLAINAVSKLEDIHHFQYPNDFSSITKDTM